MFKKILLLSLSVSFNISLYAMEEDVNPASIDNSDVIEEDSKMEIDDSISAAITGKRKRDENKQSEILSQPVKKNRLECETSSVNSESEKPINFLQSLPEELQLLICSFVVKNNRSIGECFRNLYVFSQINKENLKFIKDKKNLNYLLRCITHELDENDIYEILCLEENELIRDKLARYIYQELLLNKEYMVNLLKNLIEDDFPRSLATIAVLFNYYLPSIVEREDSLKDSAKILDWLNEIFPLIKTKFEEFIDKSGFNENRMILFENRNLNNIYYLYQKDLNLSKFVLDLLENPYKKIEGDLISQALEFFSEKGSVEIIKFLLPKNDIQKNKFLKDGQWPFRVVAAGQIEMLKFLLDSGADILAGNNTLLTTAIQYNNREIAQYLISKGARVTAGNILYAAQNEKASEILHLLVNQVLLPDFPNLQRHELNWLICAYLGASSDQEGQELIKRAIKKFIPNWDANNPFEF